MPAALDAIVTETERGRPPGTDRAPDRLRQEPPSPARSARRLKDAAHRVEECQSPVFLFVELEGDRVAIHADAPIEAPDGPRLRRDPGRGARRRDGRGDPPGPERPDRADRPARDPGHAPRPRAARRPPPAQGRGDPRGDRPDRRAAGPETSTHLPPESDGSTSPMAEFVKVANRGPSFPPAARSWPRSTAGRSPCSTSMDASTRSTTSAPTMAARSPRASSMGAEIRARGTGRGSTSGRARPSASRRSSR